MSIIEKLVTSMICLIIILSLIFILCTGLTVVLSMTFEVLTDIDPIREYIRPFLQDLLRG